MNFGGFQQHTPAVDVSVGAITTAVLASYTSCANYPHVEMADSDEEKRTWLQGPRHLAETGRPVTASSVQSCTVQDSLQEGMSRIDDNPLAQVLCRE